MKSVWLMAVFLLVILRCWLWQKRVLYFPARMTFCWFLSVAESLPERGYLQTYSRNGGTSLNRL
jgi:hypothetical protein